MFKVINLSKKIGAKKLFHNLDIQIDDGEKVAIVGSSGVGKSTLLRCIAGLEEFEGEIVSDEIRTMIFQDFNLFPHMTVIQNINYVPIKVLNKDEVETNKRSHELLNLFLLIGLENKYPAELSGGQQQRVAIIRGIMAEAKLLIMDEPSSALDNSTTMLIASLLKNMQTSLIFATHDDVFLNHVATKIFELTAEGSLKEIIK
jgi:polar amino acid transport system ATP-binding protein